MKKKTLLLTSLVSTLAVASLAAVFGLYSQSNEVIKADPENLSVTFVKGNDQAATTTKGNKLQLESRYDGDFIFDADDTYLAKTNGETNAFLGLDGDSLVQKIIAFTIVYTSSPHDDYKVNVSFRASHSWSDTERAQLDSPVSGKRYTFDDPEFFLLLQFICYI